MFDLLAFALAIICLLIMLLFRAAISFSFNKVSAHLLDTNPAEEIADLLPEMEEELKTLGFEGPEQVAFDEYEGNLEHKSIISIFKNTQDHTILWCHCSQTPANSNNLLIYWTTMLEDKRVIVSQAFDPYFELTASELMPAQTISGETLSKQLNQHQVYLQSFKTSVESAATEAKNIIYQASEARNRSLDKLVTSGKIQANSQGILKPNLAMALKILWLMMTRPKGQRKPGSIPVSRLVKMAEQLKVSREREPRVIVQLSIFAASLLFSVAIGAYIWDMKIAIILMLVIIFHELGHYFAMRMFGYKSVHIMALPLVGGVTMGFDTEPNAWRQAWMSLMGPLPGILLGWGVIIWYLVTDPSGLSQDSVSITLIVLLLINYLNILPVLPLDGGHVVESLIPPRWLKLKGLLIILACSVGAIIAYQFEFYILVFLALLQLLVVPTQFKNSKIVSDLYQDQSVQNETKRPLQLRHVFAALEKTEGASEQANKTINKAESILHVLTVKPMQAWQRIIIGAIYSFLLIVPVGALIVSFYGFGSGFDSDVDWEAREISRQARQVEYKQQASEKTINMLVNDISLEYQPGSPVYPVSKQAILAKEEQLGISLPDAIKEFYLTTDGLKALGIVRLSEINIAENTAQDVLNSYEMQGKITAYSVFDQQSMDQEQVFLKAELLKWLSLSNPELGYSLILIELSDKQIGGENRVLSLDSAGIYPTFRNFLEHRWVSIQESKNYQRELQLATKNEFTELIHSDTQQLITTYREANELTGTMHWLISMMIDIPENSAWPEAALQSGITAAENRLKVKFPAILTEIYSLHNGIPSLSILPVAKILYVTDQSKIIDQLQYLKTNWLKINTKGDAQAISFDNTQLTGCLVVGGYQGNESVVELYPNLLWCPLSQHQPLIDLQRKHIYPDFRTLTIYKIANRLAGKVL